jgi:hypothetical protein
MSSPSWLRHLRSVLAPGRGQRKHARRGSKRAPTHRPSLEVLEGRLTPSFTPAGSYAVGPYSGIVLSADFNNDNFPDLATGNGDVLLGNGDGTFRPAPNPVTGGSSLAVGDFDRDGNLDLAAVSDSSSVQVLLGHGDGTFTAAGTYPVVGPEASLSSVAVGDFTGDGLLDLGVTSNVYFQDGYDPNYGSWGHFEGSAHVLVGNGSGDFSGPNTTPLGYGYLWTPTVADFNDDGIDDIAAPIADTAGVKVLFGDAGGFLQGPTVLSGSGTSSVASADLDGDLDADLVTTSQYSASGVTVWLGDGAGGFGSPEFYAPGAGPMSTGPLSAALADVNADGKLDILTTSYSWNAAGTQTSYVAVLLGNGDGTFHSPIYQYLDPGSGATALTAADFDGDGRPDVALASVDWTGVVWPQQPNFQVDVLRNAGDWTIPATLAIDDVTVIEGDGGTVEAVFTVTRGDNLGSTVTVNYSTANGNALAGSDYVAQSGTLTFGPGETTKTIKVLVKGDLIDEYDQRFYVNLSAATGANLTDGQGVCTIVDNDPPPTITITARVSGKEGNKNSTVFTFFVTLSAPSEKEVQVNFATADGTASTADNDYVAKSGTLVFAPGQTSKSIPVTVKGDKKKESNETFFLNLTGATNATIVGFQGVGEILNDDSR